MFDRQEFFRPKAFQKRPEKGAAAKSANSVHYATKILASNKFLAREQWHFLSNYNGSDIASASAIHSHEKCLTAYCLYL